MKTDQNKPWRKELTPYAKDVAESALTKINKEVPENVAGMPYARQWVLEEAINILQSAV